MRRRLGRYPFAVVCRCVAVGFGENLLMDCKIVDSCLDRMSVVDLAERYWKSNCYYTGSLIDTVDLGGAK